MRLEKIISNPVFKRDRYRCRTCSTSYGLIVHHVNPRRKGGSDDISNLITLCRGCHEIKHPWTRRFRYRVRKKKVSSRKIFSVDNTKMSR